MDMERKTHTLTMSLSNFSRTKDVDHYSTPFSILFIHTVPTVSWAFMSWFSSHHDATPEASSVSHDARRAPRLGGSAFAAAGESEGGGSETLRDAAMAGVVGFGWLVGRDPLKVKRCEKAKVKSSLPGRV